jgi:hypothetical protein
MILGMQLIHQRSGMNWAGRQYLILQRVLKEQLTGILQIPNGSTECYQVITKNTMIRCIPGDNPYLLMVKN